jgi:phosphoribosyl 1,2-cyclic phosphodiesterase
MRIKFWGTRGSIPTPITSETIRQKIKEALVSAAGLDLSNSEVIDHYMERLSPILRGTVGGNTPCVEIQSGDQRLIIDAGSGLRELGLDLMRRGFAVEGGHADFLMSHTHWDHVQGFPFFQPAFLAQNSFTFYSPIVDLQDRFTKQQDPRWFPIPFEAIQAKIDFVEIAVGQTWQMGNFEINSMELSHPGKSYGYRIEDESGCFVYASDAAYDQPEAQFVEFFRDADLLVFDSHFSFSESLDKFDWGHSTAIFGAEFAYRANIKRLALFHHSPVSKDETISLAMQQAQAYLAHRTFSQEPCEVIIASDGMEIVI